jgi:Sulfatase-modifying factor enzyme 1
MKVLKIGGVIFAAVLLTTLAIDASDTLSGKGGTLLAQLAGVENTICPAGMVHVPAALTFSCVDEFEAAPSEKCIISNPEKQIDTEVNLSKPECGVVSDGRTLPWRFIGREQAAIMCTRAGKRLPSAAEWYQFVLGTPSEKCNIKSTGPTSGSTYNECSSAAGIKSGVGNVWEWVSDDVIDGVYQGRALPATGYIVQTDNGGVATMTALEKTNSPEMEGYFWANATGTYAIIRGGYYGSREDSGVFTTHTYTAPTFAGAGIGFRCVR